MVIKNNRIDNINLTDEEKLELIKLCADKKPCTWTAYAHKLNIACDGICPNRKMVIAVFKKMQADEENKKYEKEYPDG